MAIGFGREFSYRVDWLIDLSTATLSYGRRTTALCPFSVGRAVGSVRLLTHGIGTMSVSTFFSSSVDTFDSSLRRFLWPVLQLFRFSIPNSSRRGTLPWATRLCVRERNPLHETFDGLVGLLITQILDFRKSTLLIYARTMAAQFDLVSDGSGISARILIDSDDTWSQTCEFVVVFSTRVSLTFTSNV